jgi:hypothetical protein
MCGCLNAAGYGQYAGADHSRNIEIRIASANTPNTFVRKSIKHSHCSHNEQLEP